MCIKTLMGIKSPRWSISNKSYTPITALREYPSASFKKAITEKPSNTKSNGINSQSSLKYSITKVRTTTTMGTLRKELMGISTQDNFTQKIEPSNA